MDTRLIYANLGIARTVTEIVEKEAQQIGRRLDVERLSYERDNAILQFNRAVMPMLLTLATVTDKPSDEWLRAYVADRAAKEAQVIVDAALERQRQQISFSSRHYQESRAVFHQSQRAREANRA